MIAQIITCVTDIHKTMSLILTKSTPGHPAFYVNRFKNTFEIKPNAEIAVQEVVLNPSKKFVVGPDDELLAGVEIGRAHV